MGDVNQLLFIEKHAEELFGPYLEVGSKDYGSTQDLESVLVNGGEHVRVDLEAGERVDVVLDLTRPFEEVDRALDGARFGTVFCLSVLEHCAEPFRMAENLTRLLEPGGKVCISAPFAWRFHGYPSDYWRFTHEGVKRLFSQLEFPPDQSVSATSRKNDFKPIDEQLGKIPFGSKAHWQAGHVLRGISAKSLGLLSKIGILRWLAGYRYVLAPTNLMMIGTLSDTLEHQSAGGL
jgi:SAM-dependent methyltransferase